MSAASNVKCHQEVLESFEKLHDKRQYRYIIYRLRPGAKSMTINLDKTGDRDSTFSNFVQDLPKDEPRFAVYDCSYITSDWEKRDRILFVFWSPFKESRVTAKTLYSSSKHMILSTLRKVQLLSQIEITDRADLVESILLEAVQPVREKIRNI